MMNVVIDLNVICAGYTLFQRMDAEFVQETAKAYCFRVKGVGPYLNTSETLWLPKATLKKDGNTYIVKHWVRPNKQLSNVVTRCSYTFFAIQTTKAAN